MGLSQAETTQFDSQGYLVKGGLLSEAALRPLILALSDIVEEGARRLHGEGKLASAYEEEGFETRLAHIYKESEEAGEAVLAMIMGRGGGQFNGESMLELLRNTELVDCVSDLIGPDIVGASAYRIRPKLPGHTRTEVPWHQDSGYFLPHCDRHLIVTCWIPLVDTTVENGCLNVIPGVHKDGVFRHYTGGHGGYLEIPGDELPQNKPIPLVMKRGDVLFMTNLTPHASFVNHTGIVRWSIDLRYQSMDAPNNSEEDPSTYTPERDPVTMACYPSEADFVIRDSSHPDREVTTPEAFRELRDRYHEAKPYNPGRGWTRLKDRKEA
ncbi:MAG: phytanoyl-CoA dioxygenase family protein [Gemmatimonadetes bacterium]|nr:phytanoyl-CoA dioxygenase family protein [Gemmatimonadota bacterium]MYD25760.1 phytanoyl-CoA dioxygenase family protein [Gemmatimonadota bacterium]